MNRAFRFLLLALFVIATFAQEEAAQQEMVVEETVIETPQEPEPVQQEAAPEVVVEEVVEEPVAVEEPEPAVEEVVAAGKSKFSELVDTVVDKSKSLLDKVKSISKKDAKKIAAGVVGIWGVSVGVGYLTNQAAATPPPANGKKK